MAPLGSFSFMATLGEIKNALGRNWWQVGVSQENNEDYVHVEENVNVDTDADSHSDRVCMSRSEYAALINRAQNGHNTHNTQNTHDSIDSIGRRDRHVLYDDLYPPYGRSAAYNYDQRFFRRVTNIPTQGNGDTYRLVGYLTNQNGSIPTWKLFGKQRDRNRADFYITPAHAGYDVKIQLTDDMIIGREKLRDMDTIPNEILINSPMMDSNLPYTFVELPKSDLKDLFYF